MRSPIPLAAAACGCAVALATCGTALGGRDILVWSTDQLRNELYASSPGDRIRLAGPGNGGNFSGRLYVDGVHGTAGAMIEVVADDPADRPVFTSDSAACFTLIRCSYIRVDGIIAEHGGTPTAVSNQIEYPYGSHMILANSVSRYLDHEGNSDGVKFARSDNILMYNCTVEEWGDGGSAVDQMVSRNSLVMRSTFRFPSLEPNEGANGFQPKGDSYRNGYYRNTFLDGSSRCVQFGGSGGVDGWEGYDMVAMGNVIVGGEASVAYVSCRDCLFEYNTIVDPEKWVMRILNEGGWAETGYNTFKRNLVEYGPFATYGGIQNVGGGTQPATFDYAENYWYKWNDPAGSIPSLPGGETDPAGGTDPDLDAEYRPRHDGARDYGAHAPGMEAAWAQHTGSFAWAWQQALAYEPDARAGEAYGIAPTLTVELDGSGSYAGAGVRGSYTIGAFLWDLDGDNVFGDASGPNVTLAYEDLTGTGPGQLGLAPGQHTVELRIAVTNEYGTTLVDWGTADLLVLDELLPGDANVDGVVNVVDLGVLANHYAQSGLTWRDGDFSGDGVVNVVDLGVATHYGSSAGGAAVPEPAVLLLLGASAGALRRRRRR